MTEPIDKFYLPGPTRKKIHASSMDYETYSEYFNEILSSNNEKIRLSKQVEKRITYLKT